MIHLDRNHHTSPLSPHNNNNNILPQDQLKLLPRSPLSRTSVAGKNTPTAAPEDDQDDEQPAEATSPAAQRSSSLSPPPESGSPRPSTTAENAEEGTVEQDTTEGSKVAEASRQSTPLSELSPPPEQDDSEEGETRDGADPALTSSTDDSDKTMAEGDAAEQDGEEKAKTGDNVKGEGETAVPVPSLKPASVAPPSNAVASTSTSQPSTPMSASKDSGSRQSSVTGPSKDKAARLLEMNEELFKVCIEFQAHGISTEDLKFQEYSTRLQANLTWLASAADGSRQGNPSNLTLPIMEPPTPVDFISTDRLQQLYSDLPAMFAREVAHRQQYLRQQMDANSSANKAPTPTSIASPSIPTPISLNMNAGLKRERADEGDAMAMMANKRRDTGESKSPPIRPPTATSMPMAMNPGTMNTSVPANFPISSSTPTPIGVGGNIGIPNAGPSPIAPPSLFPGVGANSTSDAQAAAAARDRARQQQIQQAVRQQQQQLQQQQQMQMQQQQQQAQNSQGPRQMSPSSSQGPNQGGMAQTNGANNLLGSINPQAAVQAFGPMAMQNLQMLQNPSHPFMQFIVRENPQFLSMQVPQQLKLMQQVQAVMQAKSQQNQLAQGGNQQRGGVPPQGMPNNGMRPQGQQFPGGGVPQASMAQQPHNGATFPMGGGQNMMGSAASNPQMPGGMGGLNINSLTPQQRQLLMMQHQQQQMRPGMNAGSAGAGTMNPDIYAQMQQAQQQQRMSQAGSPVNAGSPPMAGGFGNDGNTFPALRSNSTIPGIARSTRSPSDGAPSPMSPHVGRGQPDMRRMVSGGMPNGMPNGFNPQMPNWQQKNQQQQQQQSMGMNFQAQNFAGMQSPVGGSNNFGAGQNWSGGNQYPMSAPSPVSGGGYQPEHAQTPRQSSSTPAPQMQSQSQAGSPPAQQMSPNEFEMFNWAQ